MGHTLLSVLGFLSLNILLHCGHAQDAVLTIEPNWSTLFIGESVTFICDMREREDTDWWYSIRRDGHAFFQYDLDKRYTLTFHYTGHSGEFQCFGSLKSHPHFKRESNKVSLTVSDKDVILQTPASTLFEGESVTLRCRHRDQIKKKNAAFYKDGSPIEIDPNHQSPMISNNTVQLISDGSSYTCKFDEDEESDPIKLRMEPKPKAQLSADWRDILAGSNVILTCSVRPSSSSGWKYFWYRGNKTSEPLTTQDDDLLSKGQIRVSQRGLYWCRGGRGDPVYYTEYSDPVVTNRAVVNPRPNWPEIYSGETITLSCEIEDGGDAEWEYKWLTPNSYTPQNPSEHMIKSSHSGDYRCYGTMKSEKSLTEWSNTFTLTVSSKKPQPVLTVSPLWLSPGDSVTLNCNVTDPSAGWRFYWYKAVPKPAGYYYYSYELLPGSTNGTEQDSYIVHGQTHTAGYVCRAGRGDPVFHSDYSEPKFVWSGDFHSAASLTVSPDRVQHFDKQSVSLTCEGNSTKWRVMRLSEYGSLIDCTTWGTMTGSTCNIDRSWLSGVYWCESETGQFSNAVNITIPFSKSDEGFYRCKGKESPPGSRSWTSQESWMSVKYVPASEPEKSSPFPVLFIVGLVCGVLLIILLLLFLYGYRKSKDSCFKRITQSQRTNQDSAPDRVVNQNETQPQLQSSYIHDADESSDVTYSLIQFKNIRKKGQRNEPEVSCVYSDVKQLQKNHILQ
ncbi:Fc receptor-like protein 5 isoform X2 [Sebastes fasciatus]|uniref:Fc receptor-like protein 5 isoform X2 n=1 Tax=Sebastes fasciatus TaxID=394691 RepID=UPI003D9E0241